ncbi:hypothetical protein [Phenylobacterium sp.]|jgi:hypothetical protein|uniref:hypothetical protein n=1 Tax=Phenylobacterium sp. TaxID=1871053 RepID=UPI002D77D7D8|nr:hypothetical protein [Phenylobacterium sp.]
MWLRLAGAVLVTLGVIGALEYFGVSRILGGRAPDDAQTSYAPAKEIFWVAVFFVVWATSLLAAARRWGGHLKRAAAKPIPRRPN